MYTEWNWEINIFKNILYDLLLEQADEVVETFSSPLGKQRQTENVHASIIHLKMLYEQCACNNSIFPNVVICYFTLTWKNFKK